MGNFKDVLSVEVYGTALCMQLRCQKLHWPEHKVLCQAISHLSEASTNKSKDFIDPAWVSHLTPREHERLLASLVKSVW